MYISNVQRDKLHVYGIAGCMKNMFLIPPLNTGARIRKKTSSKTADQATHSHISHRDVKPLCEPKVSRMEPDFVWTHEKPIVCDSTSSGPLRRSGVIVYPEFVS